MADRGFVFSLLDEIAGCFPLGAFEAIERELGLASPDGALRRELVLLVLKHRARCNTGPLSQAAIGERVPEMGTHALGLAAVPLPFETAPRGSAAYAEIAALAQALEAAGR